jgi:hypothetical protein
VLFAMDRTWWEAHIAEVNRDFRGARYTTARLSDQFAVTRIEGKDFKTFGNSGAGCVAMALAGDALRVVLLGYRREFYRQGSCVSASGRASHGQSA